MNGSSFRIREYRSVIKRKLFTINPCLAQMFEVWQSTYTNMYFISVEELSTHKGSFDLAEFKVRRFRRVFGDSR